MAVKKREVVAFLIAPLAVLLLFLPFALIEDSRPSPLLWRLMSATALVSYAGTLALGMPAYFLLKRRGLTAFWITVPASFVLGALAYLGFLLLLLRPGFADLPSMVVPVNRWIWFGGVPGMIVGVVFWLIARTGRQSP